MKKVIIILLVFLLNGCFFYSWKDDCIYGLVSSQCFGELYPEIAHYQKPYSLGKTNAELRKKDIEHCGGEFKAGDQIDYGIKGVRDKDGKAIFAVAEAFENCMKKKGYIYLSHEECGRKNSRSDKRVCNL